MKCSKCHQLIDAKRLEALPSTTVCVNCSTTQRVQGVMLWDHKTAPYIHIGTEGEIKELKRHNRKGVRAQLPLGNKRSVADFRHEHQDFPAQGPAVNLLAAKCHPERERVTPNGKCLECAMLWYERRRK